MPQSMAITAPTFTKVASVIVLHEDLHSISPKTGTKYGKYR